MLHRLEIFSNEISLSSLTRHCPVHDMFKILHVLMEIVTSVIMIISQLPIILILSILTEQVDTLNTFFDVIRFHVGSSIDGIERVACIKLLGVIVQESFSVEMHVNYILSLPHELRAAPSLNSFKRKLKTHLFNTAFNL